MAAVGRLTTSWDGCRSWLAIPRSREYSACASDRLGAPQKHTRLALKFFPTTRTLSRFTKDTVLSEKACSVHTYVDEAALYGTACRWVYSFKSDKIVNGGKCCATGPENGQRKIRFSSTCLPPSFLYRLNLCVAFK